MKINMLKLLGFLMIPSTETSRVKTMLRRPIHCAVVARPAVVVLEDQYKTSTAKASGSAASQGLCSARATYTARR